MRPPYPELSTAPQERLETVESRVKAEPEIAGFQSYESFANNNAKLKKAFIDTDEGNLDLHYTRLVEPKLDELVHLAHQTEATLVTLLGSERDEKTDALYDAIEYRNSEMFMVHMSARMNDKTLSPEERAEAAEWFKLANENLYGTPKPEVFAAIVRTRLRPSLTADFSNDDESRELQSFIAGRTGEIIDIGYEFTEARAEKKALFDNLVHQKFDELLDHIVPRYETDEEGNQVEVLYTAEEIVEVIRTMLDRMGATELGWRCELVPDKELMAVSAHKKLIEVGANRAPAGAAELRAKVVHEAGTHALRSVIAEKAGWLSAAYGQQGYLDFEEALANAIGAVYWGSESGAAPDYRYIAYGFAYGLDSHEPRDMRDTYELMWRTIALDRRTPDGKLNTMDAKMTAFLQCHRIFRGTPTDIPGLTYNKDLAYVTGRELVEAVIDLIETMEDLELLLCGKLDLTQPDHLEIAEKIKPNTPLGRRLRSEFALAA